jgi:hypothetical protein
MPSPKPETVMATYRVPKANISKLLKRFRSYRRTLERLGLVTVAKPIILRREEKGGPVFYEIFDWANAASVDKAHRSPKVMADWDAIGRLCRPRGGKPAMEFPHVVRVKT